MIKNLPVQIEKGIKEIEEAQLYREAGFIKKGEQKELEVLKKAGVPLLHVWESRETMPKDIPFHKIMRSQPDFYNSSLFRVSDYSEEVPREILKRILTIENKGRLYVLQVEKRPDPLLLWLIPWKYLGDWYIILEEWK